MSCVFFFFLWLYFIIKCYSHWKQAHEEDLMLPVQEMWDYSRSSSLLEHGKDRKFPESHFRLSPCRESDWQPENSRPAAGPGADLGGKVRRLKSWDRSPPRRRHSPLKHVKVKRGFLLSFKCFFFSESRSGNWDFAVFLNIDTEWCICENDWPHKWCFLASKHMLNMLLKLIDEMSECSVLLLLLIWLWLVEYT